MSKKSILSGNKLTMSIMGIGFIIIMIGSVFILTQQQPTVQFVNYGTAPNFSLQDQDNKSVTINSYNNSDILIVYFMYTHCPDYPNGTLGTCSLETAKMNTFMQGMIDAGYNNSHFHIISISFDYLYDNPHIMKEYGMDRAEGNFKYWSFLSGSKEQTENATKAYGVYAEYFNETTVNTTSTTTFSYKTKNNLPVINSVDKIAHNSSSGWSHTSVMWLIDKNRDLRLLNTGSEWTSNQLLREVQALIHLNG